MKIYIVLKYLSARVVLTNLLITVVIFFVAFLKCYFLVKVFFPQVVSFKSIIFTYSLISAANIIHIIICGLVEREGVAVFTLSIYDASVDVAVSAAFCISSIKAVFPALHGTPVIAGSNWQNKSQVNN